MARRVTRISSATVTYVRGATRGDLPAMNFDARNGQRADGQYHNRPRTYRYVDTGRQATDTVEVLYTDQISSCCGVALWSPQKVGLAHVVPGALAYDDALRAVTFYAVPPTHVILATTAAYAPPNLTANDLGGVSASALLAVCAAIQAKHGEDADDTISIKLVTGHAGAEWSHTSRVAADPQSGPFFVV